MSEPSANRVFMLLASLHLGACAARHDEAARVQPASPAAAVTAPPFDLPASGLTWPTAGAIARVSMAGRPFSFQPIYSVVGGDPTYTLQIMGDHISMAAGCPAEAGGYSFTGNILSVCGSLYTIEFTATANHYILNGHAIDLRPGGVIIYFLSPSGQFTSDTG